MKLCKHCLIEQPDTEFPPQRAKCKSCLREYRREYANGIGKEKVMLAQMIYQRSDKGKAAYQRYYANKVA